MIKQSEISKLANRLYLEACDQVGKRQALRIQEPVIERDYVLAWLLTEMTTHPVLSAALAFKGGTALRRVHFDEYRFSEDLDFTLVQELTLEQLFDAFREVFASLFTVSGIQFSLSGNEPTRHIRNDTFYFDYKGPLPVASQVKVDITRGETVVFPLDRKAIRTTYAEFSDLPIGKLLQVYSFSEIIVEKTLAITDGARKEPRDLYDLWYISDAGHIPTCEEMIDGLNRKLASREGRTNDILVPRLERIEKAIALVWDRRLRPQVMALPEFERCFRTVKRLLSDFDKLREPHLRR
jgi:predicted nucleotidyltransferase component of viral defense system